MLVRPWMRTAVQMRTKLMPRSDPTQDTFCMHVQLVAMGGAHQQSYDKIMCCMRTHCVTLCVRRYCRTWTSPAKCTRHTRQTRHRRQHQRQPARPVQQRQPSSRQNGVQLQHLPQSLQQTASAQQKLLLSRPRQQRRRRKRSRMRRVQRQRQPRRQRRRQTALRPRKRRPSELRHRQRQPRRRQQTKRQPKQRPRQRKPRQRQRTKRQPKQQVRQQAQVVHVHAVNVCHVHADTGSNASGLVSASCCTCTEDAASGEQAISSKAEGKTGAAMGSEPAAQSDLPSASAGG